MCLLAAVVVAIAGGAKKSKDEPGIRELGKVKPKELVEVSGIAASRANPGVLWVSNDGDSGRLYAIRLSGRLAGAVKLPARVDDTEEIAIGVGPEAGVEYLYVGDIGDNDSRRDEILVIRLPEPALNGESAIELDEQDVEQYRLRFPDGAHDSEAMFVDPIDGALYIVTKESRGASVYVIAGDDLRSGQRRTLKFVTKLDVESASAAAISPDGSRIVMRREDRGWLWDRPADRSVADALQAPPLSVDVRGRRQAKNGEAITFHPDGTRYYTLSEGKKQPIYEFDVSEAQR